jgi:hypothetical protein
MVRFIMFFNATHALRIRRSMARPISINILRTSNAVNVLEKRGNLLMLVQKWPQ